MRLATDDEGGQQELADRARGHRAAEAAVAVIGDRIEIDGETNIEPAFAREFGNSAAARMPAERSSSSGVATKRRLPARCSCARSFKHGYAGRDPAFHVEKAAARQIVAEFEIGERRRVLPGPPELVDVQRQQRLRIACVRRERAIIIERHGIEMPGEHHRLAAFSLASANTLARPCRH